MQHTGTVLRMMGRQRLLSKAVRSVISPRQIFSHSHLKIDVSLYVEKEAAREACRAPDILRIPHGQEEETR